MTTIIAIIALWVGGLVLGAQRADTDWPAGVGGLVLTLVAIVLFIAQLP